MPVEFRDYATTTLLVLDLVGTFVFALSGGLAGVKERLDLFGVLGLSFAAGNAGGITRDVLIGAVPPAAIRDWRYVAVSLLAGLVTFYWYPIILRLRHHVLMFDGAGLALFAVAGTQKAVGYGLNPVVAPLLGMLTGIGGGMLRDLLLAQVPTVLRAELYAVAALAGAVVVMGGHALHLQPTAMAFAGAALCFGLRLMAIWRGWHLPIAYPPPHPDAEADAPSGKHENEAQR
ncbi:MAG: trimeric intracellular cation channel family protein [Candidatus Tectomicrobia bacterium]|nr:trimeric intracellular cation channel family protein [Candidatus Tectomicrobia bacterium]